MVLFLFIIVGLGNVAKACMTLFDIRKMVAGGSINIIALRNVLLDVFLCGLAWGSYIVAVLVTLI